ncbi:MAG TPA: hypothetical protein VIN75_16685 [Burkholderiaceae bacterium]
MLDGHPERAGQLDKVASSTLDATIKALAARDAPTQDKVLRDYCATHFRDLASGVWRQRTPRVYEFLRAAP